MSFLVGKRKPATRKALSGRSSGFANRLRRPCGRRCDARIGCSLRHLACCNEFGAHLSRNAWRENSQGYEERFVTVRHYRIGRAAAEQRLQRLLAALAELGENIVEVESEYTVYDSNVQLDAGWLLTVK